MKIDPHIRKSWKIPKDSARLYSVEKIEKILSSFNRAGKNNYYVLDYYNQKLIMGASSASTFCGYPKDAIKKKGIGFYQQILDKDELKWWAMMNEEAFNVFFDYPESQRENLKFTYDLIAETITQQKVVLHHRLIPYKLCENGNMWLGLFFVSESASLPLSHKANISNFETGEAYNFINSKFIHCDVKILTPDEITILEYLAKDMQSKEIYNLLKISESALMRTKKQIFTKLGVKTATGAIHKAHLMRLV
jgi:DNA-binding CsgD family transcriptional regulator